MNSPKTNSMMTVVAVAFAMLAVSGVVGATDRPMDDYVATAQTECFASKRIMSCFRYKAARYLWSAANGRLNFFEPDNSRTLMGKEAPTIRSSFHFVQLTEPSTEVLFPEARQQAGASTSVWLFLRRSLVAFLNAHGIRFSVDERRGARILTENDDDDEGDRVEGRSINNARDEGRLRKKKWQVIVPLAILGKLMHLKMMVMQILFGLGAIQAILIGGGVLLYYYLKHNTLCRIEPHLVQTHSHVVEASLPADNEPIRLWKFMQRSIQSFLTSHGVHFALENGAGTRVMSLDDDDDGEVLDSAVEIEESRKKKKRHYKKKKWQIILPLAILLKLTHLKLIVLKVLLGVGGVQVILIVFGALLFHYLKNNTLCKIQPHLVHTHSHVTEHEPEVSFSSYNTHAASPYIPASHGSFNKDWASSRAYSGYSFLDVINEK